MLYLLLSFVLMGGGIAGYVVVFYFFGSCDLGIGLLSAAIVLGILCTVLSLLFLQGSYEIRGGAVDICVLVPYVYVHLFSI